MSQLTNSCLAAANRMMTMCKSFYNNSDLLNIKQKKFSDKPHKDLYFSSMSQPACVVTVVYQKTSRSLKLFLYYYSKNINRTIQLATNEHWASMHGWTLYASLSVAFMFMLSWIKKLFSAFDSMSGLFLNLLLDCFLPINNKYACLVAI